MEAQVHYINLAPKRLGFESGLCHILILYPISNRYFYYTVICLFSLPTQYTLVELIFCGLFTSTTLSLLCAVQTGHRSALNPIHIHSCPRMHTLTWLVSTLFISYCFCSCNALTYELAQCSTFS